MTKERTVIYNCFDVVLVPFPFIDAAESKKRPALVLSSAKNFNNTAGASILAMITTKEHSPWPLDSKIEDIKSAGLPVPSIVRMKLFTLDHRLIIKKLGSLSNKDQKIISNHLGKLLPTL